jgi:hypothetical protein
MLSWPGFIRPPGPAPAPLMQDQATSGLQLSQTDRAVMPR